MASLTILHVSDLHWSPSNSQDLDIVVSAMLVDIDRISREQNVKPDIIVFSGDLAMGGDDVSWFQGGYDHLLLPLSRQTGIGFDRIFVAPGNHDVARETVRRVPSIEKGLREELTSTAKINYFMDRERSTGSEKDLALQRLDNFYDAHDSYHPEAISRTPFLRSFKFQHDGRQIGIACLNSAWRASGEADDVDYRKLIVGERAIDQALSDLHDCEFRVAVHHHPLDWLVPADCVTTDFLTRKAFNLSCCGHVHAGRPAMSRDASGTCITSQAGSVFDKRDWFNGYQVIEVDIPSQSYTFIVREYINSQRRFDAANTVCDGGRVTLTGITQGDPKRIDQVELFLRTYRDHLRSHVAEQLTNLGGEAGSTHHDIMDFICPPIVRRNRASMEREDGDSPDRNEVFNVDDLIELDEDLLIIGDRQSGKTSIANFMAYKIAFSSSDRHFIPVYIDLRDYKMNRYAIRRAIINYYGPAPQGFNLDRAIDDGLFVFLVDNLTAKEGRVAELHEHCTKFPKNRWIIFSTPDKDGISPDRLFNEKFSQYTKLHVKELTRGGIRAISKKWCKNDTQETKAAYDIVIAQLVRDGLPRTPYMVSLLLWAIQEKRDLTKINEAILLSNIVDHLLGKADFRQSKRGVLNPIGKEITLQNLALFLHGQSGVADENSVTSFLIEFFDRKKLPYIGSDVLDKLIDCGILKRDGDSISFRHACFQEYFFASLLKNDRKLLASYLDGLKFLEVRREMELLAGIRQQNDDIIESISRLLDSRVPTRFANCAPESFDKIAEGSLKTGTTQAQLGKIRRTRLTDEQVDEMMDEADRRAMSRGERPVTESIERAGGDTVDAAKEREAEGIEADMAEVDKPIRPSTHMAAIDTLARVIRNSDFTDYEQKGPATKRVIESWSKIFLLIMEEIGAIMRNIGEKTGDPLSDDEFDMIKYLMSKYMFNGVSSAVVNHLSSPSMNDTLHSLIEEGALTTGEYLIVLFLLEDSDDITWQDKWREIIGDKSRSGFVVDCFVGRLFTIAHTKALDDDQARRVRTVVGEIDKRLDWSNTTKSKVFEDMREAVAINTARENRA